MTIVYRQSTSRPRQYLTRLVGDHKSPITVWHYDRALACNLSEAEAQRIVKICKSRASLAAKNSAAKREPEADYGVEPS